MSKIMWEERTARNFEEDDFSRYGYVNLLHEKSQSINALKVFVNEVERQLDKKVKIVRSDRGGEYYGKYDESRQCPGPFAKFLESRDICTQYTMPGTPQQNGVAERRNRTLMEMVRSMISKSSLPKSLWIYALKTVGCPTEAQVYNPQEKKLDSQTVSGYFIGYPEKSKGYRFYYPNHSSRIVKTGNAKFLENGEVSGSVENQVVDIHEIRDDDPSHMNVDESTTTPDVVPVLQNQEQHLNKEQTPHEENKLPTQTSEPVEIALNKPARVRKSAPPDDYIIDAMNEELKSMAQNKVWDLVNLPEGSKRVGCKWVFKTKRDSKGNVDRYKARLVAKELHQMDVKITFLNENLEEEVYMEQPEEFVIDGKEKMVCKLKKSIYGLKKASRSWYIKFNDTITSFGFEEIIVDRCIYHKISGRKFILLVLYVDDIFLATNDFGLLHKTKEYLSKNFEMKDMGETSYVIGILIFRDIRIVSKILHRALRIEESLRMQDSDKGKDNEVVGTSVNMTKEGGKNKNNKHNKGRKLGSNKNNGGSGSNKKPKMECWKCGKTGHFKRDWRFGYYNNGHVHYKRMLEMSKDDLIPAIDENPEKCFVMFTCYMRKKALDKFRIYKTEVELPQNDLIKTLRTDRGGEYYDPVFFQSIGIIHETTAPYTPQQNGVAERKNRALKEMVNSMAVVRLPDLKRKTLGEKGIDCIFVGYAEHSKAYKFYVIEPNDSVSINSIIESRDAIFDENRFSTIPRPKDVIPNSNKSQRDDHPNVVPIEGSKDQVGSQYSYCYSIEEDPRTYNEAMQSRDDAF
ncbi:retrovirus-related pol polyprotein from transposon TNT 1-94 [Tanacetum coccineum]